MVSDVIELLIEALKGIVVADKKLLQEPTTAIPALGTRPEQVCARRPRLRIACGVWSTRGESALGPLWDHPLGAKVNVLNGSKAPAVSADEGKCVTPLFWGSSGRRFKSCQPDESSRR